MPKRILLIRPPARTSMEFGGVLKKGFSGHELELGLLYIASFLEAGGMPVSFLDMSLYGDSEKRLIDTLKKGNFDFIGLTSYTNSIKNADSVAGIIRQYSNAKVEEYMLLHCP